ncbi:MAG: hypothetical protein C5B50_00045 [Verrucomicrobia bacterium]|nr:MAG: hypothetical protein C5B50_00045 [Verrucomicrobiota bacterium]
MPDIDKTGSDPDITGHYADIEHKGQEATDRQSDPCAGMAGQAHGDLAADAAAYLERSGHSLQSLGEDPKAIERQAASLIGWALAKGCVLPADYTVGLPRQASTTAEHQVFYRAADKRAVKLTYPGTSGATPDPKGAQRAASPLFYLHRLALMNRVFKSGLLVEGLIFGPSFVIGLAGDQPSIVTSQPWIRPADPEHPHPSYPEISRFMTSLGFEEIARSYYGWQRKEDAITIFDARPDNFIKSAEGVVPIDLVICEAPNRPGS